MKIKVLTQFALGAGSNVKAKAGRDPDLKASHNLQTASWKGRQLLFNECYGQASVHGRGKQETLRRKNICTG
jgi:hypothetical protein